MERELYFGHPVNAYKTPQVPCPLEDELLRKIAEAFPAWKIVNPNEPKHQTGYEDWKATTGNGMGYFINEVMPSCHGGIFLPFRDGRWGAGVFKEAQFFENEHFPIWTITPEGFISHARLEGIVPLTVDETRARVRTPDGKIIPYD